VLKLGQSWLMAAALVARCMMPTLHPSTSAPVVYGSSSHSSMSNPRLRSVSVLSDIDLQEPAIVNAQLAQWGEKLLAGTVGRQSQPPPQPTAWSTPSSSSSSAALRADRIDVAGQYISSSMKSGLGFIGEAVPRWLLSARSKSSSSCDINGIVVLRGRIAAPLVAQADTLQKALTEVLSSAGGPDLKVSVSSRGEVPQISTDDHTDAIFSFEVTVSDPNDKAPILEVLRLEAVSAGARSLLPHLADLPGATAGGHLSVRVEITSNS